MPIDDNINKLRALLVILVVLIHSHNVGLIEICDPETSAYYTVFDNILTQKITAIALPGLFLISGYLFCRGLKVWKWDVYVSKLQRRIKSIIIPFVIWNMLLLTIFLAKRYINESINGLASVWAEYNGWHFLWDGCMPYHTPILIPTWYLRDLMIFVLLVPCLHYMIRKTFILPFIVLSLCSITGFWPTDHVCLASNLAFFTLGMCVGVSGWDKMVTRRIVWATTIFAMAVALPFVYFNREWLGFILIPPMVLAIYFHANRIPLPRKIGNASMFIYLAHGLYFHMLSKMVVCHLIPYSGTFYSIIRLLIIPALTITMLTILYTILEKYTNKTLRVLTGNR